MMTVVSLLASSCIVWDDDQLGVSTGVGIYVYIYREPTAQIQLLRAWQGSDKLTLYFMSKNIAFGDDIKGDIQAAGYYLSGIHQFFHYSETEDFAEARVNASIKSRCLLMHRNPVSSNKFNWTFAEATNPDCKWGQPFPLPF